MALFWRSGYICAILVALAALVFGGAEPFMKFL